MKELEVKTWDEIQDMDFPTEEPIVDGLLYNGTYLFVGSPKIGKSFFMLDLCYHVASGIQLWGRTVKQGTALYVAREDDFKRIRKRMHLMYGIGSNEKMKFVVESEGITSGLIDQLEMFIKNYPDTQLIVLDTLQKVRGNGNGADQYNYGADYEMIGKLKDFTDRQRVCLILVHHTRKMEASDPFDMISGSSGLLGAVDGAFVMYKIIKEVKVPFKMIGGNRIDDTPVHKALREALANCLINADFYGTYGVVIKLENHRLILENPGYIRVGKKQMFIGGRSDPRNKGLMKRFNLIDIGERAGSGVPNILNVWEDEGFETPEVVEEFDPDRTRVTLSFEIKQAIKTSEKKATIKKRR